MESSFTNRKSDIIAVCIAVGILIANVAACHNYTHRPSQSAATNQELLYSAELVCPHECRLDLPRKLICLKADGNVSEGQSATPHNEASPSFSSNGTSNTSISPQTTPTSDRSNLNPTGLSLPSSTFYAGHDIPGDRRRSSAWSSLRSVPRELDSGTQTRKNEKSYRTLIEFVRYIHGEEGLMR